MAEQKTKKTTVNVKSFLNDIADDKQRQDALVLLKMMQELTGEDPRMWGPTIVGFGEYHYVYASGHEGDTCLTGFAPRKGNLVLYMISGTERFAPLLKKLGKHKATKGCLYIKRLADIDLAVLREIMAACLAEPRLPREQPKAARAAKPRK